MTSPKPTDSEQLLDNLQPWVDRITKAVLYQGANDHEDVRSILKERDQQRLSAALEALPKPVEYLQDSDGNYLDDKEPRAKIRVVANEMLDQCIRALTAALGPDNSKIEE